jgi:hypothetical protein
LSVTIVTPILLFDSIALFLLVKGVYFSYYSFFFKFSLNKTHII